MTVEELQEALEDMNPQDEVLLISQPSSRPMVYHFDRAEPFSRCIFLIEGSQQGYLDLNDCGEIGL